MSTPARAVTALMFGTALLIGGAARANEPSTEGMVWVPGGEFVMGTDEARTLPNERPAREVQVDGFWMDATPVTNARFRAFAEATGYKTTAERPIDWDEMKHQVPPGTPKPPAEMLKPGALVFTPPPPGAEVDLRDLSQWWRWVPGASWKHPEGPDSDLGGRDDHPVVHVSWEDARAYADWAGKRLPTEAEWEYAARGGTSGTRYPWGDAFKPEGEFMANTFTGEFPVRNDEADGFAGTSSVKAFPANGYGLYDMMGNVWEWTADTYRPHPEAQPIPPQRVIKGGSHLCHPSYCESYRPPARRGVSFDTGSGHTGFRCVSDAPPPANE